jgi:hypothetical protein
LRACAVRMPPKKTKRKLIRCTGENGCNQFGHEYDNCPWRVRGVSYVNKKKIETSYLTKLNFTFFESGCI